MEPQPPDLQENEKTPTVTMTTPPQRSTIFFGRNGLRAGWSLLIYIVVLVGLIALAQFEVHWFAVRTHQSLPGKAGGLMHPSLAILSEASILLAVLVTTGFMALLERRRIASYGLAGFGRTRQFVIGLACGFVFLSILIEILVATHHLVLDRISMPAGRAFGYAAAWALCFFLVGITEEFMLRGYLLFTLARGIRFWPAAFVLAALFGLLHRGNPEESPFGLVSAALIALVFSLSLWRLGHLWWAIGFHTAWDWGESFFYGTADSGTVSVGRFMHAHPAGALLLSGGATGPEGSAWIALILVLAALFVWFTQPHHGLVLRQK